MNRHLGTGRAVALALISTLLVVLAPLAPPAVAATNTVVESGFPNDYALAIADSTVGGHAGGESRVRMR